MPRSARRRPLITANFAVTWDGHISTRRHTPSDFSSKADKQRFLEIRALADAVVVTARTAAADGMTMGLPSPALRAERQQRGQEPYPLRVLVTNSGRIKTELPLWKKKTAPVVIFSTSAMPRRTQAGLKAHAELRLLEGPRVLLREMVAALWQDFDVRRLHCEGGGELLRALLAENLLDELYLTLCPRVFGGKKAPTLTGAAGDFLPTSAECRLLAQKVIGDECFLHYRVLSAC